MAVRVCIFVCVWPRVYIQIRAVYIYTMKQRSTAARRRATGGRVLDEK